MNQILSERSEENANRKYDTSVFQECVLYVTVEPCIMCASFLRQLGIKKVFFGASNEKFGGTGGVLNIHRANGRTSPPSCSDTQQEEVNGRGKEGDREGERGREREEGDYEVSGGWLREEAIVMLRRFYVQENGRAPEEKRGKEGRVLRLDVNGVAVSLGEENGVD